MSRLQKGAIFFCGVNQLIIRALGGRQCFVLHQAENGSESNAGRVS